MQRIRRGKSAMSASGIPSTSKHPGMSEDSKSEGSTSRKVATSRSTYKRKRRKNKGPTCSAPDCKNSRYTSPNLPFFKFPRDEERCKKWVKNCGRQDLIGKTPINLFRSHLLCALHFEDSQFTDPKTRRRLRKQKAVPTRFKNPVPYTAPGPPLQPVESPPRRNSGHEKLLYFQRKVDRQRKHIKRLQARVLVKRTKREELAIIKSLSAKYLGPELHEFFCSQFEVSATKSKFKQWSEQNKSQARSIYDTSPTTYRILRKMFYLPSISCLQRSVAKAKQRNSDNQQVAQTSNGLEPHVSETSNGLEPHVYETSNGVEPHVYETSNVEPHVYETSNKVEPHVYEASNGVEPHVYETSNGVEPRVYETSNKVEPHVYETSNGVESRIYETSNKVEPHVYETSNGVEPHVYETSNGVESRVYETSNKVEPHVSETSYGVEPHVSETSYGVESHVPETSESQLYTFTVTVLDGLGL